MFKHILLPTDGSALSGPMIRKVVAFAHELGARITAIHVQPDFHVFTVQAEMVGDTRERFREDGIAQSKLFLEQVKVEADKLGVPCESVMVSSDHPYEAIVQTAREHSCDLICMASHGRRGVQGLLLGSETQKVLTHSAIPVLVFR